MWQKNASGQHGTEQPPKGQSLEGLLSQLRDLLIQLPPGTYGLVIRVDEPARFGLPSVNPSKPSTPPSLST